MYQKWGNVTIKYQNGENIAIKYQNGENITIKIPKCGKYHHKNTKMGKI
jgi:hypothetical protein